MKPLALTPRVFSDGVRPVARNVRCRKLVHGGSIPWIGIASVEVTAIALFQARVLLNRLRADDALSRSRTPITVLSVRNNKPASALDLAS